ncbi:hypothetical protein S83_037194, partial [Arachis hypogaea]
YSSADSSFCCKHSSQSPSMEAFLDSAFYSNDLCYAVMLTSIKVFVGLGLQKHATWYVNRRRKHHLHAD